MTKHCAGMISIVLAALVCQATAGAAATKMSSGFYYPTPLVWTGNGNTQQPPGRSAIFGWLATDQDSPPYPVHNSHRGIDIYGTTDSPIYAITSGTVATNYTSTSDYLNKNLWIKHDLEGGGYFYAVYGHVNSSLAEGTRVSAGQQIATVAAQNNPHLHLGIHPSGVSYPWGRGPIPTGWSLASDPDKSELPLDGWVAPRTYLETHAPPGSPPSADKPNMTLSMTSDRTTALPGETITYTISYRNTGAGAATNVTISTGVPANTIYVAGSGGTQTSGTVTWTLARIEAGASGSVSFRVRVN